jgi:Raf kinase inhibitor-like YbhB/YbcL family protein
MAFAIESSAFPQGGSIPKQHTCDGADVSPPLAWREPPAGAKSYALICDDPDAPAGTWTHWIAYCIPPQVQKLAEGVSTKPELPDGTLQGKNDFKRVSYGGPCPPQGKPHRYFFKLYALDVMPTLIPGLTRFACLKAIEGHVLAKAELMGTYARS